jgi:hypothetical protein
MKRFGLVLLVFFFAISVGGCACVKKQAKEEPAPVQTAAPAKTPEPVKPPPPPPKKDRN